MTNAMLSSGLLLTVTVLVTVTPALTINTVTELKVDKYTGRWYQMYTSAVVELTFELGAVCVTADYGLNPNNTVSVLNSERVDSPDGALKVKAGYATASQDPGKLTVNLEGVPFAAPYWVVKLGPETFGDKGQYQYSVITDSLSASLFVLARDVAAFRQDYQAEVLQFLSENGFTKLYNTPLDTLQTSACRYGPPPEYY